MVAITVHFAFSPGDVAHWPLMKVTGVVNDCTLNMSGEKLYFLEWSDKDAHVTGKWVNEEYLVLTSPGSVRMQDGGSAP